MRILYQQCCQCGSVWYLPKAACGSCGAGDPVDREGGGSGVLRAKTTIYRAASPEFRDMVPYAIGLIAAEEGFVLMALVPNDLELGAAVEASFRFMCGKCLPFFVAATAEGMAVFPAVTEGL